MAELSLPMYTEEKTAIQFEVVATRNDVASDRMGRAMFDKLLRVYISNPGHKDIQTYEVDREYAEGHPLAGTTRKNEQMYKRFGKYIEAFKSDTLSDVQSGTPINMWPMVDVRAAAMFKHLGITTVEQLADLSDTAIGNIGTGGREWVRRAKAWIDSSKNAALATQLSAEKSVMEDRFSALERKYTELAEAMVALPEDIQGKIKTELLKRGKKAA